MADAIAMALPMMVRKTLHEIRLDLRFVRINSLSSRTFDSGTSARTKSVVTWRVIPTHKTVGNDDHRCHPPDTTLTTPYDRDRIIDIDIHSSFLTCPAIHLGTRDQWLYQSRCQGNNCRKGERRTSGSLSCPQESVIASFQPGTKVLPFHVPKRNQPECIHDINDEHLNLLRLIPVIWQGQCSLNRIWNTCHVGALCVRTAFVETWDCLQSNMILTFCVNCFVSGLNFDFLMQPSFDKMGRPPTNSCNSSTVSNFFR